MHAFSWQSDTAANSHGFGLRKQKATRSAPTLTRAAFRIFLQMEGTASVAVAPLEAQRLPPSALGFQLLAFLLHRRFFVKPSLLDLLENAIALNRALQVPQGLLDIIAVNDNCQSGYLSPCPERSPPP